MRAPLVALLMLVPVALATHEADLPPLLATGTLASDGYIHWTYRMDGTTRIYAADSFRINGTFGAGGFAFFTPEGAPAGSATSFGYARRPPALLRVNDHWFVPTGGDPEAAAGGGLGVGPAAPARFGEMHVLAWVAGTGAVKEFRVKLRMDNATLLAESYHPGTGFAWTTRELPEPGPLGLFGPGPGPRAPRPESGEVSREVRGVPVGHFFAGGSAALTIETAGTCGRLRRAVGVRPVQDVAAGAGTYAFRFADAEPHSEIYLAGVDAER